MKEEEKMSNEYSNRRILSMESKRITPEMACKMLEANKTNRDLSWKTVQLYAQDMKRGAWRKTHEAIALNSKGEIMDGQHRLWAIIESGYAQTFYVATYEGEDSALMMPFDMGKSRSTSDITNIPRRDVAILKTMVRVLFSQGKLPNDMVLSLWQLFRDHLLAVEDLHVRTFTAAPVRAAVVLRHACGIDWTAQYKILVHRHLPEMNEITAALYNKLVDAGQEHGGTASMIKFCQTWHASDPARKTQKTFRTSCISEALEEAKASFKHKAPEITAQLKTFSNLKGKTPERAKAKK